MRSADMFHYDSQTSSFMFNMKAVAEQYSEKLWQCSCHTFNLWCLKIVTSLWPLSPLRKLQGLITVKITHFYKISAFQKLTNILVHTSKPSSKRRRREQLMRNLILDEWDRPWLFTRTRLSSPRFHSASVPLVYLDLPLFCDFYSSV